MITCLRVYNSGYRVAFTTPEREEAGWLEYNRRMRPGCALFVDGVCKAVGYLGQQRCAEIEKEFMKLQEEPI